MARLVQILESPEWNDLWSGLRLRILSLEDAGLDERSTDDIIWRTCQANEWCLITGNRNSRGPDSLHQTIERENHANALPVFTIGRPDQVLTDIEYADEVVEQLLDFLLDIDLLRGTGRQYLP